MATNETRPPTGQSQQSQASASRTSRRTRGDDTSDLKAADIIVSSPTHHRPPYTPIRRSASATRYSTLRSLSKVTPTDFRTFYDDCGIDDSQKMEIRQNVARGIMAGGKGRGAQGGKESGAKKSSVDSLRMTNSAEKFATKLEDAVENQKQSGTQANSQEDRKREMMAASRMVNRLGTFSQISDIEETLFLSGVQPLRPDKIRQKKITLIVNATVDEPTMYMAGVDTLKIRLEDSPYSRLDSYFDSVADRIKAEREKGGRVLVHCVAGVSRSASLILAYYLKYGKMSLKEAYWKVKSCRPIIRPNAGFWRQLMDYERRLTGKTTVRFVPSKWGDDVPDVYTDEVAGHSYRSVLTSSNGFLGGNSKGSSQNGALQWTSALTALNGNVGGRGTLKSSGADYDKLNPSTASIFTYSNGRIGGDDGRNSASSYRPPRRSITMPSGFQSGYSNSNGITGIHGGRLGGRTPLGRPSTTATNGKFNTSSLLSSISSIYHSDLLLPKI